MAKTLRKQYRNNFILLIGFHLALIAYPLVSKTLHVHHKENAQEVSETGQPEFDLPADFCPIYNFEFYNFVSSPKLEAQVFFTGIPVYNSPAPEKHFPRVINYFSLRAPPAV